MNDQGDAIAARFPTCYWAYGPGLDVDASRSGPDGRIHNRRRQFGNMVLARWPLTTVRNHLLPKLNLRRQLSVQRAALETIVALPSPTLRVISVHLAQAAADERKVQVARLMTLVHKGRQDGGAWSGTTYDDTWQKDGGPVTMPQETIVAGDFNMTPTSLEYQQIAGANDPATGRAAALHHLVDAWPELCYVAPDVTFDAEGLPRRLD